MFLGLAGRAAGAASDSVSAYHMSCHGVSLRKSAAAAAAASIMRQYRATDGLHAASAWLYCSVGSGSLVSAGVTDSVSLSVSLPLENWDSFFDTCCSERLCVKQPL